MRGKAVRRGDFVYHIRITPAYAGKSQAFCLAILPMWDHPRLCGEKAVFVFEFSLGEGSPPPMRGKGKAERTLMGRDGITPAYAGKSPRL